MSEIESLAVDSILPSTAVIELTYACSHRCLYCSCPWEAPNPKFKKDNLLSAQEWEECIRYLVERHHVIDIAFTGGEPTLNPDLPRLIRFATSLEGQSYEIDKEKGKIVPTPSRVRVHVISNGRRVTDDLLDLLAERKCSISSSLPGLSTYETHTCVPDPSVPLNMLTRANERGIQTTLNVTVTKINLFELYETIAEGLIAGGRFLLMNRFLPGGRGLRHIEELSLNREELIQSLEVAQSVLSRADIKGSLGTEVPRCVLGGKTFSHITTGTLCSAATSFFVIDPSGRVRVCNHSEHALGNWRDIERIATEPYWQSFVHKEYIPYPCKSCVEIGDCDGGCREAAHITGGSLCSIDPLLASEGFEKPERELEIRMGDIEGLVEE